MAASDYTQTGLGLMCPVGVLGSAISHLQTTLTLSEFYEVEGFNSGDLLVGMGVLIDDEICSLVDFEFPNITVARGCADTVPAFHFAGTPVWFFSANSASDNIPYLAGETIAVKASPYSTTGQTVPIENTPPLNLTFNERFARPYPPGDFRCNGVPWFEGPITSTAASPGLNFTWVPRDRILQGDQLVGHTEAGIGPEPGTTYNAYVYDGGGSLQRTVTGITEPDWLYSRANALADIGGGNIGYIDFYSVRDGLESLQFYRTEISVAPNPPPPPDTDFVVATNVRRLGTSPLQYHNFYTRVDQLTGSIISQSQNFFTEHTSLGVFLYGGKAYKLSKRHGSAAYALDGMELFDQDGVRYTLSTRIVSPDIDGDELVGVELTFTAPVGITVFDAASNFAFKRRVIPFASGSTYTLQSDALIRPKARAGRLVTLLNGPGSALKVGLIDHVTGTPLFIHELTGVSATAMDVAISQDYFALLYYNTTSSRYFIRMWSTLTGNRIGTVDFGLGLNADSFYWIGMAMSNQHIMISASRSPYPVEFLDVAVDGTISRPNRVVAAPFAAQITSIGGQGSVGEQENPIAGSS